MEQSQSDQPEPEESRGTKSQRAEPRKSDRPDDDFPLTGPTTNNGNGVEPADAPNNVASPNGNSAANDANNGNGGASGEPDYLRDIVEAMTKDADSEVS
jgi:hypothetical protein